MGDLNVLGLLDRVHAAERDYYRLLLMPEFGQVDRSALSRARTAARLSEDEFYRAINAVHPAYHLPNFKIGGSS